METFSALLVICEVPGEFPVQRPVTRSFGVFVWINGWVNNAEASDLRRYRGQYDVIVMWKFVTNKELQFALLRLVRPVNKFTEINGCINAICVSVSISQRSMRFPVFTAKTDVTLLLTRRKTCAEEIIGAPY